MKRWLGALLVLAACSGPAPVSERAPDVAPSATTRWITPQRADTLAWLEGPARVIAAPNASVMVSVPLPARVLRVFVRPGERVAQGAPLVEVVMPELIRAAGTLHAADIRLGALTQRHAHVAPLLKEGLARASEVAELESQIALARADRESARATLRAAGESDARAAALVDGNGGYTMRAPAAGMVVAVSAQLGQVREPASGPLVELVSEAAPQIEARFSTEPPTQVGFEWIELNRRAALVLDALSPRAGLTDGTRMAWLHADKPEQAPLLNVLGRVRMVPPASWRVVPIRALATEAGALHVQVRRGERESSLPVTLIRESETEAIVDGLADGDLVAADAAQTRERSP